MQVILRITTTLAFSALLLTGAHTAAAQAPPGEYEVKAAFLYNLLSFVDWPPGKIHAAKTVGICLLGRLGDSAAFDELNGHEIMGKKIQIRHLGSLDELVRCEVLFISPSEQRNLPLIMKALEGSNILSIGDTFGFARQGVIINFYLDQKRVRFEINSAAAKKAGLTISAKLLKLAGTVYGTVPGE